MIQALLSILTVRLMTELLDQKQVGNQYLINSVILWFSLVLINPVGMYVNRHIHEWQREKKLFFVFKQLNKYFLFVALLSIPIIFGLKKFTAIGEQIDIFDFVIYAFFYIFISTWFQTLSSFFNLFEYQKQFVFLNIISQAVGLVFSFCLVKYYSNSAVFWLVGLLVGQLISLVVGLLLGKKYFFAADQDQMGRFENEKLLDHEAFKFCLPVAITTLFMWFSSQGYRIIVDRVLGAESLASLGVGLGIAASVAAIIESIATQYFYPKYYSSLANSNQTNRRDAWLVLWKSTVTVYLPFCFLTIATAPFLVKVLASAKFGHVVPYVIAGAVFEFFRQSSNISYIASHAELKPSKTILPYMFGGVVLLLSLILLINFSNMSNQNILIALGISSISIYIYNFVVVKKLINIRFDFKYFFKVLLISVPVVAIYFLELERMDRLLLFLISSVCGFWILASVGYLFRKLSNNNSDKP